MTKSRLFIIGILFIHLWPLLSQAELLWFDDFEQDTVGGPAQGWDIPPRWTQPTDTTWKVVMDGSTKVYRHWSGDSTLSAEICAVGYDPPPVSFTAQVKIKVTDFFPSSSPYFFIPKVGFCYGGNVTCCYSPIGFLPGIAEQGLYLKDSLLNTPYFAYLPYDLEMNRWYYFKMGQSDTVNLSPPQIYFKIWPEEEEEPEGWMIYPAPGGHYIINWWEYLNMCVYLSESVCHHYLGFCSYATYANFDEVKVFSELEEVEVDDAEDQTGVPEVFQLYQNYPNPFNTSTTIAYFLPFPSNVVLYIYNISGQQAKVLVDENQSEGFHTVTWDGKDRLYNNVGSGIYFCRLKAGTQDHCIKMLVLK